jgi:hypothetical protein
MQILGLFRRPIKPAFEVHNEADTGAYKVCLAIPQ